MHPDGKPPRCGHALAAQRSESSVPYDSDRSTPTVTAQRASPSNLRAALVTGRPPATVRGAGAVVALEGVAALAVAVVLVMRGLRGGGPARSQRLRHRGMVRIVGGGVLAAGWALWTGRRWGRGLAVFAQLLLLPVSWYIAVGSHQWLYGIPIAIVARAHAGVAVQPVRVAVGGGSGCGQCGQLRTRHPVGDPVVLRVPADGVVEGDRVDVPVQHRPRQPACSRWRRIHGPASPASRGPARGAGTPDARRGPPGRCPRHRPRWRSCGTTAPRRRPRRPPRRYGPAPSAGRRKALCATGFR